MIKLVVVADDFTGALDTGVQFSKQGIRTLVITGNSWDNAVLDSAAGDRIQVLVLDTQSRHVDPREAYSRVRKAAEAARLLGVEYVYKKTDSTLRGNIGSELEAVMDAWQSSLMMFVPAFPGTGRTTVGGSQYVNGIPLAETSFAKDPLNPMATGFIPDILKAQSAAEAVLVGTQETGPLRLEEDQRKKIYIFDGETDSDILKAGNTIKDRGCINVTAGCAGFANFLPGILGIKGGEPLKRAPGTVMLAVCGSVNEASFRQVAEAEKEGFLIFTMTPQAKLDKGYCGTEEGIKLTDAIAEAVRRGTDVVLRTAASREEADECTAYAVSRGMDKDGLPLVIAENMGRLVKNVFDKAAPANLVVFGGDTAVEIMQSLGCKGVMPLEEIQPGVAVSKLVCNAVSLNLVTKAGGFGKETVLCDIRNYLKGGI